MTNSGSRQHGAAQINPQDVVLPWEGRAES